jgi:hypothetical protein
MQSATLCQDPTTSPAGQTTIGGNQILITSGTVSGLVPGDAVSAPGYVVPGSEISSVQTTPAVAIYLTQAAIQTGSGITLAIHGDNTGTQIHDASPSSRCWYKTDYRGEPHEWGAVGNGMNNDTVAIENWLGAYGSPMSQNSSQPPNNFGPWIAKLPGNYKVSSPLTCPANATIQGSENLTNNNTGNQATFNPRVSIFASNQFSGYTFVSSGAPSTTPFNGTQAVIGAMAYCRLSGIAVLGNSFAPTGVTASFSSNTYTLTLASSVTNLEQGNTVAGTYIPSGTVVTNVLGTTVTISQQTTNSSSVVSEPINFYGPDAVDALGDRLTVDGFSLLANGHYDLFCGIPNGSQPDGISIKDTSFQNGLLDDIHIPGSCANVRLIDDIVADAGGDGVFFSSTEADIEGGVIEESQGVGLHLAGASKVSVTGMHIQGNGLGNGGKGLSAGIVIDHSSTISICGNHLEGNGGDTPQSSQVFFAATAGKTTDNVTFCGNVYGIQNAGTTADVTLSYVYDADPNVVLTNTHFYETAEQPAVSVFSANAQSTLASLAVPQFTQNLISGLGLSNDGTSPTTVIDIGPGSAADSTNSTIIQLPFGCSVNLGTTGHNGAGYIDTGNRMYSTTYFIYAISAGAGSGNGAPSPSCMASAQTSRVPLFTDSSFNPSGYVLVATGGTLASSTTVLNVSPLAGAMINDAVNSSDFLSATTIQSFSSNSNTVTPTGNLSNG